MQQRSAKHLAAALSLTALGAGAMFLTPSSATAAYTTPRPAAAAAHVDALNNSGVTGTAKVTVKVTGTKVTVRVHANGLLRKMPHAMHIHHGPKAKHHCPTVRDDRNRDHRLNVLEGVPQYGPIAASLTTRGDTSPKSGLAVDRFPTTPNGRLVYARTITVSKYLAAAIKRGEAIVVIHGLDYNQNAKYDLAGAGRSELDRSLPTEATDPAACGVLHKH